MNDMNPTDNQSSIVNSQSSIDTPTFRPFQPGDRVRIRQVNGCFPYSAFPSILIQRKTIGELGKKVEGNIFEVFFGLYDMVTVDSAYLELVTPAKENGDRFFLHLSIGYKERRYEIYHGSFSKATFVCSFSDKYYTKEKAEEEIARLRAQYQQPVKKN